MTAADPVAAALARSADAGIHCLPIPTPFQVGRVNTYLIEDDPLTLVDSGPNSGTALDTLERALAAHGRRVEDLGLIVISHQHIDHLGLVSILARRSGAEVAALDLLAPRVERRAGVRAAVDERQRVVLDEVRVDAADRERRGQGQAVDPRVGGPLQRRPRVAHDRMMSSTSSRRRSMSSMEMSDSRHRRMSGSVLEVRTLKCHAS